MAAIGGHGTLSRGSQDLDEKISILVMNVNKKISGKVWEIPQTKF